MRWVLTAALALAAPVAWATYHTFQIDEIFSNADGTIQYVVLHETEGMDGQNLLAGKAFTATQGTTSKQYFFQENLPGSVCDSYGCSMLSPTAHAHVLIATQGFAALGLVTPDYVIPNGFIPLVNGTLNYAGADLVAYAALPTDGVTALKRTGATIPNVATNFAGKSASANAPGTLNYQGLWWKSPGGSEDGWGINFAHQGKTIFGTWFTYDTTGKGWWLTLITDDSKSTATVFEADLFATTGPPFNTVPVRQGRAAAIAHRLGDADLHRCQQRLVPLRREPAQRQGLADQGDHPPAARRRAHGHLRLRRPADRWPRRPTTRTSGGPAAAPIPGTEQGWGINFAQQGDVVFASWFTYDLDGTPLWLVATLAKLAPGLYQGDLLRPSGPRFDAYDKSQFQPQRRGRHAEAHHRRRQQRVDHLHRAARRHGELGHPDQEHHPPALLAPPGRAATRRRCLTERDAGASRIGRSAPSGRPCASARSCPSPRDGARPSPDRRFPLRRMPPPSRAGWPKHRA